MADITKRGGVPLWYFIDTNSGNVIVAPDAYEGAEYIYRNNGTSGNTLTLSLTGVTDPVLPDGQAVNIHYFNGVWVTSSSSIFTNLYVSGDFAVAGGIQLTQGRNAFNERMTPAASFTGTGWYTIAELASGNAYGSATTEFHISTPTHMAATVRVAAADTGVIDHQRHSIEIVQKANTDASWGIVAARLNWGTTAGQGLKVQVYVMYAGTQDMYIQMSNNVGVGGGFYLVTATQTNIGLTVSGATASFLVAGEEYNVPFTIQAIDMKAVRISDDSLICTIMWKCRPYSLATALTITDPSTSWIISFSDGSEVSVTGLTASSVSVSGYDILCTISKTSAFAGITGVVTMFRTNGTGAKLVLS